MSFHLCQGIPAKRSVLNFYPLCLHTKIHSSLKLFARHKIAVETSSAVQKPSDKQLQQVTKSRSKKKNLTVIKTCPTTAQQRHVTNKKKRPIQKSQILSNIIFNNIYDNLHQFNNDIIVQVHNGNTKTTDSRYTKRP